MAGYIISRFLDTVGDGSGNISGVLNYLPPVTGIGTTDFFIAPAAGETFIIHRMITSYSDGKSWSSNLYGKDITLLTGIEVLVENSEGLLYNLTDPESLIFTNGEWASVCYDFALFAFGAGDDWAAVRWTFSKSGMPVTLRGDYGEKLIVRLADDFTGLTNHTFMVQGYQVI